MNSKEMAAKRPRLHFNDPLAQDLLIEQICADVSETASFTGRAALENRVIRAMRTVPRHVFVPEHLQVSAYANQPLPIGYGQTISQPYIVALMTDLLKPQPDHTILEIGTGSGYQAAVLAQMVKQVYSLEIIPELARRARQRLAALGYGNVEVGSGDGHFGWPEHAPFDAIIVTAATARIPPALIDQLKPGGTLVIPIGGRFSGQELRVVSKDDAERISQRSVLPVVFVPLTGAAPPA